MKTSPGKSPLCELIFAGIKFCKFWSISWKSYSVKIIWKLSICEIREIQFNWNFKIFESRKLPCKRLFLISYKKIWQQVKWLSGKFAKSNSRKIIEVGFFTKISSPENQESVMKTTWLKRHINLWVGTPHVKLSSCQVVAMDIVVVEISFKFVTWPLV